jgi:Sulfotransferase family
MQSPIFIFSLPRSGSTLLQRVCMSHSQICSVAEPWLLLPQIYALRDKGILSEYSSLTAYRGISDFIENLPNMQEDYNESLRCFLNDLYAKQCRNGEHYFLDKTPRYYLIIDEIIELFPDAKFIFLFRNPIHIYASIVNTWGNKRFNRLFSTYDDIKLGTKLLSKGYRNHKDKSLAINYEKFVTNPTKELERIFKYLEINFDESVLREFSDQTPNGQLGDPTGVINYTSISTEGLHKWKNVFNSYVRKKFAIKLFTKLDEKDLLTQGYNKNEILAEIKTLNNKKNHFIIRDLFDYFTSFMVRKTKLNLFVNKDFYWIKNKHLS